MKLLHVIRFTFIFFSLFIISSCGSDDESDQSTGIYSSGVLITNEGPFQTGSGTVSFFDPASGTIENGIFESTNSRLLGNIVQSAQTHQGKVYIVVNNANKMEIVQSGTFQSTGLIENISLPRYFLGLDAEKGYVSQWGETGIDGKVAVINLGLEIVSKTIPVGSGAEEMAIRQGKLYVCNSGGFGNDSTLTIIDVDTDEVIGSIEVGDNPNSIEVDGEGFLWVACSGKKFFNPDFSIDLTQSTAGRLVKIDPTTDLVVATYSFSDVSVSPTRLTINSSQNILYYLLGLAGGSLYSQEISSNSLDLTVLAQGFFYSLGFDPLESIIYLADPVDFASAGRVIRYNTEGNPIDTLGVGIIPGNFDFN